jgi:hypothetical protein
MQRIARIFALTRSGRLTCGRRRPRARCDAAGGPGKTSEFDGKNEDGMVDIRKGHACLHASTKPIANETVQG